MPWKNERTSKELTVSRKKVLLLLYDVTQNVPQDPNIPTIRKKKRNEWQNTSSPEQGQLKHLDEMVTKTLGAQHVRRLAASRSGC